MHLDRTPAARAQRREAIRAMRAGGVTMRELARRFGVSIGLVHYLSADVQLVLLPRWHRARMGREAPAPAMPAVHRVLAHRP